MADTDPTTKKLYLTRHAQAEHNVTSDWTIRDAVLTDIGKQQARELNDLTKETIQRTAELLVCSPLRRPMETTLIGFPALKSRLDGLGKPIIILDILQEVGPFPCDTPLYPVSILAASNDGIFSGLDFSTLTPEYAGKRGIYAPENAAERAKRCRIWLRDRSEREIVVMAHGDILRNIVDGHQSARMWDNAETKIFTFRSATDPEATLLEIDKVKPETATDEPTSSEMT